MRMMDPSVLERIKWIERLVWRLGGIDCPMLMQAMEFFGA